LYSDIQSRIKELLNTDAASQLQYNQIGIEKESLRMDEDGSIAQTVHPVMLGSALTHRFITTDYSEALIEFVTPPEQSIKSALEFLEDLHMFVYKRLDNEILWSTSMPCVVKGESTIPVAQYGLSNLAKMKTVYREGLGYRYGKNMQIISGVHFNFSFSKKFWQLLYQSSGYNEPLQEYINQSYFSLIRNLLRVGWIIPYLFGASPAVCKSFFSGMKTDLSLFDENTYYEPFATSLRMSDIGYQNNKENEKGFKACYDNLDEYIANIKWATETPCREYEKIGVKVNGEYKQLNANILQIENEYYSTVRPKQITRPNEMPVNALKERGIQYIELRSIDINAFDPIGINETQLHFLEALMLFCLLTKSPEIDMQERNEIDNNEMQVALKGRTPGLKLSKNGDVISLFEWSQKIFSAMRPVCELLDKTKDSQLYTSSLDSLSELVDNPEKTPSARMLNEMKHKNEAFHTFAKRMSYQHNNYFKQCFLSIEKKRFLEQEVNDSVLRQQEIELSDDKSFDSYIDDYFSAGASG